MSEIEKKVDDMLIDLNTESDCMPFSINSDFANDLKQRVVKLFDTPVVSESLLDDMELELRQSKQELPKITKGVEECYYEIGWKKSQEHFRMLLNNSR